MSFGSFLASQAVGAASGDPGAGGGLGGGLDNSSKAISRAGHITTGGLTINARNLWGEVAMWSAVGVLGLAGLAAFSRNKKRGKK